MRSISWRVLVGCLTLLSVVVLSVVAGVQESTKSADVEDLYVQKCATCHEGGLSRAPNRTALAQMSSENIRFALTRGTMKEQAQSLTMAQIEALSKFLSTKNSASARPNNRATRRLWGTRNRGKRWPCCSLSLWMVASRHSLRHTRWAKQKHSSETNR